MHLLNWRLEFSCVLSICELRHLFRIYRHDYLDSVLMRHKTREYSLGLAFFYKSKSITCLGLGVGCQYTICLWVCLGVCTIGTNAVQYCSHSQWLGNFVETHAKSFERHRYYSVGAVAALAQSPREFRRFAGQGGRWRRAAESQPSRRAK